MLLLDVESEFHLRVDAALDNEIARLLKGQRGLFAGLLIASVEREPVSLDERVMDRVVVTVDQGDRIASVQEQVGRIVVPTLLQNDADGARETGLGRPQRNHPHDEREGTAAENQNA